MSPKPKIHETRTSVESQSNAVRVEPVDTGFAGDVELNPIGSRTAITLAPQVYPETKINKKVLKQAIKEACPTIEFQTHDGMGTPMSTSSLHVRVNPRELEALEAVCKSFGTEAWWPMCSEIYGKVRQIPLLPKS